MKLIDDADQKFLKKKYIYNESILQWKLNIKLNNSIQCLAFNEDNQNQIYKFYMKYIKSGGNEKYRY
jgi:hypothetical protein